MTQPIASAPSIPDACVQVFPPSSLTAPPSWPPTTTLSGLLGSTASECRSPPTKGCSTVPDSLSPGFADNRTALTAIATLPRATTPDRRSRTCPWVFFCVFLGTVLPSPSVLGWVGLSPLQRSDLVSESRLLRTQLRDPRLAGQSNVGLLVRLLPLPLGVLHAPHHEQHR